jgi:hypothetical protein
MAANQARWEFTGDYFGNCNCDVVCPCFLSAGPFLSAKPTNGFCELALVFHVDQGQYGDISLDDLNTIVVARIPGQMDQGNWSVAVYVDERADKQQRDALQQIFTGAAGGPLGAVGPLISTVLGVKAVPIHFRKEGKRRAIEVPGVMQIAVHATPGLDPEKEVWIPNAHPFAPEGMASAVGEEGNAWTGYGMRWDNSGKAGDYASIKWSNS